MRLRADVHRGEGPSRRPVKRRWMTSYSGLSEGAGGSCSTTDSDSAILPVPAPATSASAHAFAAMPMPPKRQAFGCGEADADAEPDALPFVPPAPPLKQSNEQQKYLQQLAASLCADRGLPTQAPAHPFPSVLLQSAWRSNANGVTGSPGSGDSVLASSGSASALITRAPWMSRAPTSTSTSASSPVGSITERPHEKDEDELKERSRPSLKLEEVVASAARRWLRAQRDPRAIQRAGGVALVTHRLLVERSPQSRFELLVTSESRCSSVVCFICVLYYTMHIKI